MSLRGAVQKFEYIKLDGGPNDGEYRNVTPETDVLIVSVPLSDGEISAIVSSGFPPSYTARKNVYRRSPDGSPVFYCQGESHELA